MLSRYSRLCFSKLDNAGHGPRYASFTSEYPRRNLAPPDVLKCNIRASAKTSNSSISSGGGIIDVACSCHRFVITRAIRGEVLFG